MTTIGFLHTSPVHVPTFRALVDELLPGAEVIDVVDEVLLAQARQLGTRDVRVIGGVADRIAQLVATDAVVCTCSTIGGIAELVGHESDTNVVRVDRAMAERAVELAVGGAGRIAVVAAIESTLEPTRALLDEVMLTTGASVDVELSIVDGAWNRFEAGDHEGYLDAVAEALPSVAANVDVVVLAQASMAPAVGRVDLAAPVLSSPRLAIEALRDAFV
jgi:hypothetical protein